MHSIWSRANTVFAFTLTVITVATILAFVVSIYSRRVVDVEILALNPRVKTMTDYSVEDGKSDMVMLSLNIHADMSPVFNWNVKQLFLYLIAEYSTMKNVVNQVVLWDKIIKRTDTKHVILEQSIHPKYYFLDDGSNLLSHQNITLLLKWNIVPNAGHLATSQGDGTYIVKLPSSYVSGRF